MGVQGLWEIIGKAGQSRALTHLAVVDGFEKNTSGRRAYRVGIDASLWYQHAEFAKGGANPDIRLLFYRLRSLGQLPILPLFVFDGRERPKVKRGSKMGKAGSHKLTAALKKLLDAFGMEWRMARGEAEAELAHLNKIGVIDAVMTDDVDALVFGASIILRNQSLTLIGNKASPALNAKGKPSKHHVTVFSAEAIRNHPEIQLSRGGLVLIALLAGGDYDNGVNRFGTQIAHGLARLGYGDRLLAAVEQRFERNMHQTLVAWRAEANTELHTNAHGLLDKRYPSLSIPDTFPDMQILENYVDPISSARAGGGGVALRDTGDLSLSRIAIFCEDHFDEWAHRSSLIKRFRDLLWPSAVVRVLRRAALEADAREKERRIHAGAHDLAVRGALAPSRVDGVGTPTALVRKYLDPQVEDRIAAAFVRRDPVPAPASAPHPHDARPLIRRIVGERKSADTDALPEYRVEVDPAQLIALVDGGLAGKWPEPAAGAAAPALDDDLREIMEGSSQRSQSQSQPSQSQPRAPAKPPPDPMSVMRLWLPVSMMRQVHPGLVEDYEAVEDAKRAKRARVGKRRNRRQVEDEDSSGSSLPSSPVRPASGCTQPYAPTSQRPGTYAREHSQPVAGPSRTRPTATPRLTFEEWSLPMRDCGFTFTFPDPDDPDQLVDEENSNNVSSAAERVGPADDAAGVVPNISAQDKGKGKATATRHDELFDRILGIDPGPGPSAIAKGRGKAPAKRKGAHASASRTRDAPARAREAEEEDDAPTEEAGTESHLTQMMDQILGIGPGAARGRAKGKAPARRKRRTSVPTGGTQAGGAAAKRRRTTHGAEAAPPLLRDLDDHEPVRQVTPPRLAPFPALSPIKPPPPLSARMPGYRLVRPRFISTEGLRIVEIESDDDDDELRPAGKSATVSTSMSQAATGRRNHPPAVASSSQDSALGTGGFWGDPEMVIDLT